MNAINFVVRTRTGSIERGVVGADDLGYLIDASGGREVSINLHRSDLRSYDRAENDLHILLADGRVIVLEDYFGSGGSRLFLSTDGVLSEVAFAEGDGGALFAQYADVAAWGKWSPDDSLIFFDRAEVVAGDYVATDDEGGVSMLAAGLLAGGGMLPWLAGGAAVATGAAVLGGDGGGGGGSLTGNNGESGGPKPPTVNDGEFVIGGDGLGLTTVASDITEAISLHQDQNGLVGEAALIAGAKAAGLLAQGLHVPRPTPDHWPAIALMTNGQAVLVLKQDRMTLSIWDPSAKDKTERVDVAEFAPFYSGVLVRGEAPVQTLVDTHTDDGRKSHWFWGSFSNYTRQFGEVAVGSFVANILALSVALFSLQVYDRVIPHQSSATLWVLAIGAAMALMLEAFLKVARSTLLDGAGRQIETGVQQTLLNRLLGMRSDAAGRSPSQLFASMREFSSVREFFTASTVGALADIPFIVLFLLMVWSIAGSVVWVLVAGAVLMVIPGFFLQKKMIRITREMQGASTKQSRLLNETVTELDTIKTQRAEDRFARQWEELTSVQALKSSEQRRLAAALTFWSQGVQQATYVGAVIAGTYLVFAGEFTVGSIIAVGILTSRTLAPLTQLSGIMARWGNVKAALDALDGIAGLPQDRAENRKYLRREKLEGRFELREVTFRYDPEMPSVLDIPSLVIQPGQTLAILGTNGSGKSTLLKMLAGLYAPTSGSILIDGTDMNQIDMRDIRRSLGYLGQDVRLFHGTLRDNLNLNMMERDDDRLFEALDFAGLGQFVKGHPQGLDLTIRDGGEGLSVGQRQSIGWARLWLQDPDVCLLDEPTAALDQTLEKTLISRLETWLADRTAIVATHRVPILALADRTSVLASGRLVVDGPRDQVLNHLRTAQEA